MSGVRRSLALRLVGWCAAVLPADRADWAVAMAAEVRAIGDADAALSFAAGCLWGAIQERVLTITFAVRSVRIATIGGMLALAVVSTVLAGRLSGVDTPAASVFGLTSALFAGAALWGYVRGAVALVQTARSTIPLYIIAYVFVSSGSGLAGAGANARLYRALAIEGVVIWAALLAGGIFMLHVETVSATKRR